MQPHVLSASPSYYPTMPDDRAAVYLGRADLVTAADGSADDTAVLQRAIDRVQETTGTGIVLVPPGRYRITSTLHLWTGIRLIGYGSRRPLFVLAANTPGFDDPESSRYMVQFCRRRPPPGSPVLDAWEGTFYSGISNIDFEIAGGNPGAVAVRFHVAQLSSLEHIEFRLGSARAGVEAIGNKIEDCRFQGGRFGIITGPTAAGWQSLLYGCHFEQQAEACVLTERAGLTVVATSFADSQHAIVVPEARSEQLAMRNCRFLRISGPAILLCSESAPTNQINLENIAIELSPALFRFRLSGNGFIAPVDRYVIRRLSHGLHLDPEGRPGRWRRRIDTRVEWEPIDRLPETPPAEHRPIPSRIGWSNIRQFGGVGDGIADDTQALQRAVQSSDAVYLPMGRYRITDTIVLRPETTLIGLHPQRTQIILASATAGFGDRQAPKAMVATCPGGDCIVAGIGFDPGVNPGAVALDWRAGARSLAEDLWFEWGGHDQDPKGDNSLCSLRVGEGGGGIFKNVWSANCGARLGLHVSDTTTPSHVYLMSVEHHLETEVRLERVANWSFHALQTEENIGSEQTIAVDISDCRDLEFVNLFMYRVRALNEACRYAVEMDHSARIEFRGVHSFSFGLRPFDNFLWHADSGELVPEPEMARLTV